MMRAAPSPATAVDLPALGDRIGQEVAVSDWLDVTQERIDRFADATGDHQWIHVDPVRAAASPFKTTIAHGFFTLALISPLMRNALAYTTRMTLNYGANRVRFVSVVPAGSRVRARFTPMAVQGIESGLQITWKVVVEREGQDKPCAIVEWIVRYYL